jgi:single-strand DNA-binding protein
MLNKIILMGRLTDHPELRHTANNTPVCVFTLAVEREYQKDETDFIDIVTWKNQAETAAKWLEKGQLVAIMGRLQTRTWKDRDGKQRKTFEVIASEIHFTGKRKAEATAPGAPPEPDEPHIGIPTQEDEYRTLAGDDGELPF